MANKLKSTLKTFFQTGDIPSEQNYVDLIDSFVNIKDHNSGSIVISGSITTTEGLNVSGSTIGPSIEVTSISASLDIIARHITSSGNISASGNLTINEITALGNISSSTTRYADTYQTNVVSALRYTGTGLKISDGSTPIQLQGPVSAIGNISSSLTSTGSFGRLESHTIGGLSPVTITDDTTVLGNITGSNISASGTLLGNSLKLGGTGITATAADINKLDGLTTSKAELNYLDGITNTNATIVKALNQHLSTNADVTFASLSLGKIQKGALGLFGGTLIANGASTAFTLSNIPDINDVTSGKNSVATPTFIRNANVGTNSTIIITCTTDQLAATAFGNNTGGTNGYFI